MSEEVKDLRIEKINDLAAVVTILEDYWRFHPANPDKQDVVKEYEQLKCYQGKYRKRNRRIRC